MVNDLKDECDFPTRVFRRGREFTEGILVGLDPEMTEASSLNKRGCIGSWPSFNGYLHETQKCRPTEFCVVRHEFGRTTKIYVSFDRIHVG
jgi:hypothetical protein